MPDETIWEDSLNLPVDEPLPEPAPEEIAALNLKRGSDLEAEEPEPAELGLELDDRYIPPSFPPQFISKDFKGFKILRDLPPQDERHEWLFDPATTTPGRRNAFYVQADDGTIGLVPWLGSTVIWPWEKAWEQDLYHEKQTPLKQKLMAEFAKNPKYAKKEQK